MDALKCPSCQQFFWDPVTVRCGHTFCRKCLLGPAADRCHVCKQKLRIRAAQDLRCNTLLCNLLEKCLESGIKVDRVKRDLEDFISSQQYEEAAKLAYRGVVMAPEDVPLRILRSQTYLALKQYPEALREAEVICNLQKHNPEGFYRKGMALLHMGDKKEALAQFHQSLMLNPQFTAAQRESEQLLMDLGRPVPSSLEDLLAEMSQYLNLSSPDAAILIAPLKAASISPEDSSATMKLNVAAADEEREAPSDVTTKPVKSSGKNVRKRKETDELTSPDKDRLSKHLKLKDNRIEDENLTCCHQSDPSLQDLLSLSDVECSLCIRMFLEPVTTPCGHTFCRECLERCMDHRPYCPLCKQSLREYLQGGCYPVTALLQDLMKSVFPSEMSDRNQLHLSEIAELSNLVRNVPIFVCTVAFPGIPCPLHVFEPRYRLMMRRCLETGTKSFGMCLYESGKSFADYGCMLEILNLDFLPDGRSLVETVGRRRFRVLQRGQLDGYHTAEVEYLVDKRFEGEELQEVETLNNMVYQQLEECVIQHRRIFMHHGPPPPKEDNIQASQDGPSWCWWLLSVLPLDPGHQMVIFSMTSLKDRLVQLKHILSVMQNRPQSCRVSVNHWECRESVNHWECRESVNHWECRESVNHWECRESVNHWECRVSVNHWECRELCRESVNHWECRESVNHWECRESVNHWECRVSVNHWECRVSVNHWECRVSVNHWECRESVNHWECRVSVNHWECRESVNH
ncbi:LON peptidase N-terminal domain and RING finger protein 1-like [Pelodytes ibericus]